MEFSKIYLCCTESLTVGHPIYICLKNNNYIFFFYNNKEGMKKKNFFININIYIFNFIN